MPKPCVDGLDAGFDGFPAILLRGRFLHRILLGDSGVLGPASFRTPPAAWNSQSPRCGQASPVAPRLARRHDFFNTDPLFGFHCCRQLFLLVAVCASTKVKERPQSVFRGFFAGFDPLGFSGRKKSCFAGSCTLGLCPRNGSGFAGLTGAEATATVKAPLLSPIGTRCPSRPPPSTHSGDQVDAIMAGRLSASAVWAKATWR